MMRGTGLIEDDVVARLRAAGCVFAEDEAAVLRESAGSAGELDALVARRVAGEPLEVVVGWAMFAGLRIGVAAGVFVARRRSELLVREAVGSSPRASVVVDLCCGTGAVGLAVATALPDARLWCTDVEPAAVACATANVGDRGTVLAGDLFGALPHELIGQVDLLLVNAPYVPTDAIATMPPEARDHEPVVALDGGTDGLAVHRRVISDAPDWLARGGLVLIETSRRQAPADAGLMMAARLDPRIARDEELDATVVIGRRL
jgi:release factor glutamine methyltransferase